MPISVFISYSHDSPEHRDFVRSIADKLRDDGLNCQIDQYINGFPPEGWQRWMETQVEQADFVLLVCTDTYLKRYRGLENEGGRGVNFEGVVISQTLYDHYYRNTKFIPLIPEGGSFENVPLPLKGYSTFTLPKEYTELYRVLTDQPATPAPELGKKLDLGVENNNQPVADIAKQISHSKRAYANDSREVSSMTDTMKAAWLGGAFAILAAIVAGVIALSGASNIKIENSNCANVNIGTSSGNTKQDCGEKNGKQ